MMLMSISLVVAAGLHVLTLVSDDLETPDGDPLAVVGGDYAQTCEYPASVGMRTGGCSGTLIHPEIVLYAAHCGDASRTELGESSSSPAATMNTEYCRRYPNWTTGNGTDFMFCKLQGAINLPIAPVIMGCEIRELESGSPVIPVGFGRETAGGQDASGPSGRKKWLSAQILGFPADGKMIGVQGLDTSEGVCPGDSGGSLYFQLDDGTWRTIGVTSTITGGCPTTSQHVPSWHAIEFIESESGIDVSPCHDADGTWNPGPDCGGFSLDVTSGEGLSWANGCTGGPTSGSSSTCGPPYGDPPDEQPPIVEIVEPANGAEYDGPEASVTVTIEVNDVDEWPTRDVTFEISGDAGSDVSVLEKEPWDPGTLLLPEGEWTMTATARDWSGNESSDTVHVYVGVAAPDDLPDDGGTDDGGADDGATGGTSDDGTDGGGGGTSDDGGSDDKGCGCVTMPRASPLAILVLLLALARRRAR